MVEKGNVIQKERKEEETKERRQRKQKQPKIIKENKKRRGWENFKKRFQTQITKYLKKILKVKIENTDYLKMIKVPRDI